MTVVALRRVHRVALSQRRSSQDENAFEARGEGQGKREFHLLEREVSEGEDIDERALLPHEHMLALDA